MLSTPLSRPPTGHSARVVYFTLWLALIATVSGCSLRGVAIDGLGDALSAGGGTFASDDDPELIAAATPFSLKLMESLLAERPEHVGLLNTAAKSFTQYAYTFVQLDADAIEEADVAAAYRLRGRASKLYRRARDYGLRGIDIAHPGFSTALRKNPVATLNGATKADVPQLYWTGVAWAAMIALSKENPDVVADAPIVSAIMERALALDEAFDRGALHVFMINLEMARVGVSDEDAAAIARKHFARAVELSGGNQVAPYTSFAEVVLVQIRNRKEFEAVLKTALSINVDTAPEWRLTNILMQRRAQWLLDRADRLFTE